MNGTVRAFAFAVIVAAHIALVALLMSPYRRTMPAATDGPYMTVVSLETAASSGGESAGAALPAAPLFIPPPPLDSGSSITLPPPSDPETRPEQPSINWQDETRNAAARMAESLEAQRRKGKPVPDPRFTRPTPRPEFGWDRSATNRIEALPEGGTIIHLNDRCALVFSGFLLPVCKIGKIEARGDLFEHMGDEPPIDDPVP